MAPRIARPQKRIINQCLISELNELLVDIKVHLFDIDKLKKEHPKPTLEEIDKIHAKVDEVLFREQESYIKY